HTIFSRDWSSDVCSSDLKRCYSAYAQVIRNDAPPHSESSTCTCPPCHWLTRLTSASPRPKPPVRRSRLVSRRRKGSKILVRPSKIGRASCRESVEVEAGA